jgi:hypothetical protein
VKNLLRPLARLAFNMSVAHRPIREVRVRGGELAGARLLLDLRYEKAYWLGGHESAIQAALRRLVDPGDVVYDVGSARGLLSSSRPALSRPVGSRRRLRAEPRCRRPLAP